MKVWLAALLLPSAMFMAGALAADAPHAEPFGLLDISLGAAYTQLTQQLDLRDINTALAAMAKPGHPDLGRRGYGCMPRQDEYADTGCVSHDEKLNGVPTREIRLQILDGRLQQLSLTAEAQYYDAVTTYLRQRYGEPRHTVAAEAGAAPRLEWGNNVSKMYAIRGSDLVFVSLELDTYGDAVARKRKHAQTDAPDCR